MVSVTLALRYATSASRYQRRSSIHIRDLIPRNSTELAEAIPIDSTIVYFAVGMMQFSAKEKKMDNTLKHLHRFCVVYFLSSFSYTIRPLQET